MAGAGRRSNPAASLPGKTAASFLAVYIAKVRITVHADGATIVREGHGTGEGRGTSPGEVHDIALKAAETDATKRALATFGKPFGLELYRNDKGIVLANSTSCPVSRRKSTDTAACRFPSRRYDTDPTAVALLRAATQDSMLSCADQATPARSRCNARHHLWRQPLAPDAGLPAKIDKSLLAIAEPKRLRDKAHLKFVASQPCLICGRQPSDPHHLRFAQPRAIGLKVSDEFTVPLCRGHHRQLHQAGNEVAWWKKLNIDALEIAEGLWKRKS